MLQRFLLTLLQLLLLFSLWGQVADDFSDGDFTDDPTWQGDVSLFKVSDNFELQLNASESGSAFLLLPHQFSHDLLEWHFSIRLATSPSANNFARFYLTADYHDLKDENLRGYYLQFGESGSADAIELYYQEGQTTTLLCRGEDGTISSSFNFNIKVNRSNLGEWQIFIDRQRNGVFQLDSKVQHLGSAESCGIGVFCQYTSSNSTKFYFDNIYYGFPIIDTIKPTVISVRGEIDFATLHVKFSENVSPESALNPFHYSVKESNMHPISCLYNGEKFDQVILLFENPFDEDVNYKLIIENITDFTNNKMEKDEKEFFFYRIKKHDVLVNEIMADPSPAVNLPPFEYIEIKNSCHREINMFGWKLQIGSTVRQLPNIVLPVEGFAIIIGQSASDDFGNYENVYTVSSMNISNGGQRITIMNENDEIIHTVAFKDSWHTESIKKEGGWSLEMIDCQNPCGGAKNWGSSLSENGGTPCAKNSIEGKNRDNTPPEIERISVGDSLTIHLIFNESLLGIEQQYLRAFQIDRDIEIIAVEEVPPDNRILRLTLSKPLSAHLVYQLTIIDSVCDCAGLSVPKYSSILFGIGQQPTLNDIVINEIMVDPFDGTKANYIEIYNRSNKIIDLKNVKLGIGNGQLPEKAILLFPEGGQLLPESYAVFCQNKLLTLDQYWVPYPERLYQCDSLPNYSKTGGVIHLTDMSYNPIDRLMYDIKMHYQMLISTKGVALEKINVDLETQNEDHWKSAAEISGFGTPGYKNSQHIELTEIEETFVVQPDIISPDQDGFDDFTFIKCRFKETENRVSISIIDKNGYIVKTIANNAVSGTEVDFCWDGLTDNGLLASPDLYIVRIHYWNSDGRVKRILKVIGVQ